jgi:hypothetical protein
MHACWKWFVAIIFAAGTLGHPGRLNAQDRNVQTCLDGRYPSLCDKSRLTAAQLAQAETAERRQNLKTCLDGRYPRLCRRELLTTVELKQVQEAERLANFATCITGRYPALCRKELLTRGEMDRVMAAERAANLEAERTYQSQSPPRSAPQKRSRDAAPRQACEDGHWIDEVLADGKIIKLEDGGLWRVDDIDTIASSIWLPISEIVVCGGKLINTDDNESVEAHRIN